MKEAGIYVINNKLNGIKYVGSAVEIRRRWSQHKSGLELNKHNNEYLQRAWNKYKGSNFEFLLIEECTPKELIKLEQFWLGHYRKIGKVYNINPVCGSRLGCKHTKATIYKMKESHKGVGYGKKRSQETIEKMRKSAKERGIPKWIMDKAHAAVRGKSYSIKERDERARKLGAKNFICLETKEIFINQGTVAEKFYINRSNLNSVLLKKRKSVSGYHFEYL